VAMGVCCCCFLVSSAGGGNGARGGRRGAGRGAGAVEAGGRNRGTTAAFLLCWDLRRNS
jgi:hypothetical protein